MSIVKKTLPHSIWLLTVNGRLDQSQTPELEQKLTELIELGHDRLIVDLSEASYINSGGLRCLVSAWRQTRQSGGNLVISGLNERLQEIFGMVGFDKVFDIYPTVAAAKQATG